MKRLSTPLLFLAATMLCGAEILRNGNFADLKGNGLPTEWEFRGNSENFTREQDGTVLLTRSDKPVMLIQNRLSLTPDTEYVFLADVNAPRGTDYSIYFEELLDGEWVNPGSKFRPGGKSRWEQGSVQFSASPKAKRNRLLIRLLNNNSSLRIRNLRIVPAEEFQNHGIFETNDGKTRVTLLNGNFERGPSNWQLPGRARARKTTGDFGNVALSLPARNDSAVQSGIMLAPRKTWRLTFFAGAGGNADARFKVLATDQESKKKFHDVELTAHPGVYQRFEFRFELEGDRKRPVAICCINTAKEPVWIDEIYLDEVIPESPLKIELTSPCYRNRIYASRPERRVAGKAVCPGAAGLEIRFNGDAIRRPGDSVAFDFPADRLETGKYLLCADAFDAAGKKIASAETAIHKMEPRKNEVVIDRGNNILVNGKRIFPIALFLSGPDIIKYAAARHGVNVMRDQGWVGDEATALALLNKAQEYGLFLRLNLGGFHELKNDPEFKSKWRSFVGKILTPRVLKHPALLYYDYGDEGIGNDVPDQIYRAALEVMDELDPYHPVSKCESPRGTVPEYIRKHDRYTHIHGMDIYPVPARICHSALADKSLSSVGAYARLYRRVTEDRKPVKLVLQAFDWGKLERGSATGLPSEAEQRYMNFDALLNGVKVIEFYNEIEDQGYYNRLFKCIEELYRWERIVNTGKEIPGFSCTGDAVLGRGYSLEGKNYYAVINRSGKNSACRFSGMPGPARNLHAPKQEIRNGDTVTLPPFGTLLLSDSGTLPAGEWPLLKRDPAKELQTGDLFAEKKAVMAKLGDAYWIWYPGETRKNGSRIVAVKEFELAELPAHAVWHMTADDNFSAKINGEPVLSGGRWTKIYSRDVRAFLRPGRNRLEITAVNGTGRCGLVAELILSDGKEKTLRVVTDGSWQLTNSEQKSSAPRVIGKFGNSGTWNWMRIR